MSRPRAPLSLVILVGLASQFAALPCSAEPASTDGSSWTISKPEPDPTLKDPLLKLGRQIFIAYCEACHGDSPEDMDVGFFGIPPRPGTFALRQKYEGDVPALLEERTDLAPEYITHVVRKGIGSMPFFRPTEISDEELEALGAYLSRE